MDYRVVSRIVAVLGAVSPLYGGGEQTISEVIVPGISVEADADAVPNRTSAGEGTVSARQLEERPLLRPAEVLETVPGLIVTQHSGDGKANQYFLRGFSLDHGTDFYTTIEGMPTNLPTHAHGQGYNDLNFLIPELISQITYKKGPYYAGEGDFASTGSARIRYADRVDEGLLSLTGGSFGHRRALNIDSFELEGGTLLYALEYFFNDGPWDHPEGYERFNGVVSYTKESANRRYKISAMGYRGDWDATNHVPVRAIDSGLIGRYGSLDPSDGGTTHRYSLSGEYESRDSRGVTSLNAYVIDYGLDLYSNFTYYLNDPVHGDQFRQKDSRTILGGEAKRTETAAFFGADSIRSYGVQFRHDAIRNVALSNTQNRTFVSHVTSDRVNESAVGAYWQEEIEAADKVRVTLGLRGDTYRFDVESDVNPADSGTVSDSILSPKLGFVFGPWGQTEIFLNGGYGFHSNDARGVTKASDPATPLVRTKGAEIGVQNRSVPGLQTALSLWMMQSDSELVFAGDTGGTEATGPSRRMGIEWANYWTPAPWFILDADAALSRARYRDPASAGGKYVPEAIEQVVSVGAAVTDYNGWFGGLRLRYFGSRALNEENTERSKPSTLVNLKAGRRLAKNVDLALDVYNLFNRKTYDIEYFYESRLASEAAGVTDHMVHPGEPRSVRISLNVRY